MERDGLARSVPVSGRRGTPEIDGNVTGAAYKLRVAYSRAKQQF